MSGKPFVVAHCEHCDGNWLVAREHDPDTLEGICMECQEDSDVEQPLTFHYEGQVALGYSDLPKEWLAQ